MEIRPLQRPLLKKILHGRMLYKIAGWQCIRSLTRRYSLNKTYLRQKLAPKGGERDVRFEDRQNTQTSELGAGRTLRDVSSCLAMFCLVTATVLATGTERELRNPPQLAARAH
eukprot:scaffold297937_cov33-Prasinocladus_malaysianus.AAC.1